MTKKEKELLTCFMAGRSVWFVAVMYGVSKKIVERVIRRNIRPGGK